MNLFSLNSSSFNSSATSALVLALVTISCSATVSASGQRQADALAQGAGIANVTVNAVVTRHVLANINGTATVYGIPNHTQAAQSNIVGSAELQLIVLRTVQAAAEIEGSGEVVVYPADLIGACNLTATADISPIGTIEQPGAANIVANGDTVNSIVPVVTRYVSANINCTGGFRAETKIGVICEAYSNVIGTADLTVIDTGLVLKVSDSYINASAICSAIGTQTQPGYVNILGLATLIPAEPYIYNIGGVIIVATAQVSASATRIVKPIADISSTSNTEAIPNQLHSSHAVIQGTADIFVSNDITRDAKANVLGNANLIINSTEIVITRMVEASPEGTLEITVSDELIEQFSSLIFAQANISGGGVITMVDGTVTSPATVYIVCGCTIYADTIANPESYDPPGRTFKRPYQVTEFIRPAENNGFGRS